MIGKLKETLTAKNIIVGYLYFYVHLVTEVICFFSLARIVGDSVVLWIAPLIYDLIAFVPQSLIGALNDKYKKIPLGTIGMILMVIGLILLSININPYLSIFIVAVGNACTHVAGAEATLRVSEGKMSHSAIFVSGGAFGVIIGKLLGRTKLSFILICILALSAIPFSILADMYKEEVLDKKNNCKKFNYANKNVNPMLVIVLATFVVAIRGYMGYGIPTTWNKTTTEAIILFFTMGLGKALGGIFIDMFGIRKTALTSTVLALPFLIFGDNLMLVSIIGVMFFSMTMAVTLAILTSILKENPGLAFGHTTIGLFLGSLPIFFVKITKFSYNAIMLSTLTIVCIVILYFITSKENKS